MEIYPAVDIMKGKAVRLCRGKRDTAKIYGDPVEIAAKFAEFANKLHVVDLDGAYMGIPQNLGIVRRIIEETGVKVQVGGGFRTYESVEQAYSIGVDNVIVSTAALNHSFISSITKDFPGITVSLDVRNEKILLCGWQQKIDMDVKVAYRMLKELVGRFIYTSVSQDGTLEGISRISKFWEDEEFIYAGGVSTVEDIHKLREIGFSGAIIGKALYEGALDLRTLKEVL